MYNVRYPAIPEPTTDPQSLQTSMLALKEGYEILTGQRTTGNLGRKAITYDDLVRFGIIKQEDIPRT